MEAAAAGGLGTAGVNVTDRVGDAGAESPCKYFDASAALALTAEGASSLLDDARGFVAPGAGGPGGGGIVDWGGVTDVYWGR